MVLATVFYSIGIWIVGAALAAADASVPSKVIDKNFWLEPEHLLIIVVAFLLAVALGGKGVGELVNKILKRNDTDVTVNMPNGSVEKCPVLSANGLPVNPDLCVAHKAENERSIRNEKMIHDLEIALHSTRAALFTKLDEIDRNVTDVKVAVAGLVVKTGQLEPQRR